jgi:hypothetical protein
MTRDLRAFFEGMSANAADSFADIFLAGDASGVKPVTRQAFLAALPARAESFSRAGWGSPVLSDLHVQELDEHYLLARTEWDAGATRLLSSYLLHRDRIVVYLNHRGMPL